MGALAEKLTYLAQTKARIRQAIVDKGVEFPENTPFRDYALQIGRIRAGDIRISGAGTQIPVGEIFFSRAGEITQ